MAINCLPKMVAATLFLVMGLMAIVPAAVAVTYKVGDASQWASGVDYTDWAAGKTFRVGDTLEFKYGPTHSVDVVNKAGYDGCDDSSATENHSDGDTKIDLKTVGPKYFICPTPNTWSHCLGGMKLAITVVASPSSPPTPDSPPSDGIHEADSGSTTPPPPPSNDASGGLISYVVVGVSLVMACNVWIMNWCVSHSAIRNRRDYCVN